MENIWMLLQQTAAGGLCALFLLLLQRIFRNPLSPRWQYGIWGVLVLRLLIPVGAWGRSTVLDVWPWLEAARAGAELTLDSAYSSPWTPSLPQGPIPLLPAEAPRSLTDWLFLLYLAGALGLALWYLGCALRLSLRVSRGVPVEGPRRAAIDAVAQRYQLPRPRRVVECRWERSPFLMGFFAPALVLPMGWEPDEKVILHELLHLKHRDLWAGWLTAALRCLHWCDPLLWLVFDKVDNDREALCDQRVLERLEGEDRQDYGRVLLSMADSRTVRVPGATTMANGARAIQARIQAITRFKRFPRGMALASGCMGTALVMALAVGGPAPGGETDPVTVSPQGCGVPGFLGRERLRPPRDPSSFPFTTGEAEEDDALSSAPMPRLPGFSALYSGMVVTRENTCGQQRSYTVDIAPYWNDPDIVDIHTTYDHANTQERPGTAVENRASFHQRYEFHVLEAGEQITFHEGGGGGSGWRDCWTGDLRQYTAPDGFTACVTNAQGETFSVPLTPRYTTPDGGSFSLAPEREEVLP